MPDRERSSLVRYGIALGAVVAATLVRLALGPLLGDRSPFVTFLAAVVFASWMGGFGPSVLALVLGWLAAAFFFVTPIGSFRIKGSEAQVAAAVFAVLGLVVGFMGGAMRSARLRAEVSAKESQHLLATERDIRERLDITLRSLGDAVLATDASGRVTALNPVAETLTGWTTAEAAGCPLEEVFRIVNEQTGEAVETPVAKVLRTGMVVGLANHTLLIAKDGTRRPIDDSASPIRDAEGVIRGVVLVFRDDSERRTAEKFRQESEARKAAILESALDCIITIDVGGRVVEFNPAAEAAFGYGRAGVIGRELCELIIPTRLRDAHRQGMARYLATGEGRVLGRRIELPAIRADGTEFTVELAISRIATDGPPLFTAYLRDITERQRAEAAAAERNRLAEFGRDVGLVLTESATIDEMLRRCAEATVRHLDGAFARIWTVDESEDVLELRASAGMYTHLDGPHARVKIGQFKIGMIAKDRKPHLTNDVVGDPLIPAQDWAEREGLIAFAGYPLVVDDRLVGVWAMFARHALSDETLRAMESVARGIALGIERKRSADAVAQSAAWLGTTLRSIGDAVIATDGEGRVRFMNPVAEVLTGWTGAEATGRPMGEVFHIINEQTRQTVEHPVARVIREGVTVGLANHSILIARDGPETPIEDSAAPIRDERGTIVGVVMVFRDVTEGRATQAKIRETADRLQFTLDATKIGQWDLDLATNKATRSLRHDQVFGYDDLIPEWSFETFLNEHVHSDSRADVERSFREALQSGKEWEIECPITRADGSARWIWMKAGIDSGADGKPLRMLGLVMDVTERRTIEEQLRAAKSEADQANKAKDQFLAVLSHELRTPLNPILLAASSMLERPAPPEEFRPTMEMIRHNVNLQARLIDDLLDVMRIVQGKMPLHWSIADCHEIINHAVQVCQSEVFGRTVGLSLDLAAKDHHVNADSARLEQVFWNLIKNAVKFSPERGDLTIRTRNSDDGHSQLIIEVQDTGIGIEPAVLPTIFDPFQQGETSITRKFGGLGLGLAISRGVVEAHGGTIAAESPGKGLGTTFRVVLEALASPTMGDDAASPENRNSAPDASFPSPSLNILVVEDEEATRRLMARLLRGLGHEVASAGTIAEAIDAAEATLFDLIVSDIGLPDGSGLDLMRRVVDLRGRVASIALTGYGMEEDIVRSREAGFTAHMTKPIDFSKLEALIRQVAG